jgi:two-component system invasion response regulator UvrY
VIRVLLVDDHELVRQGLARILGETRDLRVAGEAATGREALERLSAPRARYDLVLLDISLPDMSGLDLLPLIRERCESLPVLVLSVHAESRYAVRALRKGAAGYLVKDAPVAELLDALRHVAKGRRYVSPALAESLVSGLTRKGDESFHSLLSDREYDVFRRIAAGQRTGEIAATLRLSAKTVNTFKARILRKTGLRGTADIVRYVLEHGLAD